MICVSVQVPSSTKSSHNYNISSANTHFYSLKAIQSHNDIIFFHGHKTSDILEKHATSFPRRNIYKWSDLIMFLQKLSSAESNIALHIHNRHLKIGDILQLIVEEIKYQRKIPAHNFIKEPNREEILSAMNQGQKPMLLSNIVNENWGLLSAGIRKFIRYLVKFTNFFLFTSIDERILFFSLLEKLLGVYFFNLLF